MARANKRPRKKQYYEQVIVKPVVIEKDVYADITESVIIDESTDGLSVGSLTHKEKRSVGRRKVWSKGEVIRFVTRVIRHSRYKGRKQY